MGASWQITELSTRDQQGRYLDQCAESESAVEWVFDAEEDVASATAALYRITRDDERTSATSARDELVPNACTVNITQRYVFVNVTGFERYETYRLVLVITGVVNGDWSRTRMLEAVA